MFKLVKNMFKVFRFLNNFDITEDSKNIILRSPKNIVLESDQSILIMSKDGYLVSIAKQIHDNPNLGSRPRTCSALIEKCDKAVELEMKATAKKISDMNMANRLKAREQSSCHH
ncbi:MAG: hypothetical protein IBX57_00955 [Gammaproteobacteria bacterium]|nr:hypothetical protein [Gammaproteobacteria bacterium]